jgi:histidyl-tRNA synthetase
VPGLKLLLGGPAAGFKAQLRKADKSGARVALIVGDSEVKAGKVGFKPLREDTPQELVTLEECVVRLRRTPASA